MPDTEIVYHDIEKKYISYHCSKESDEDSIDDFFLFAFCSIERTYPFGAEIPYETDDETDKSKCSKVPLILSIESVRKGCCK